MERMVKMMKLLKSAAAAALSLAVAISVLSLDTASALVAENQKYTSDTTIFEDFETLTAEEIQAGNSPVVRGFTNSTTATVNNLASGSGKYLSFKPNGAADTSMLTKTGLFKYDVTVVDVYLRCTEPTTTNNNCAVITLKDEANNNNTLPLVDFAYTTGPKLRNRLDTTKTLTWVSNRWIPVRFILDRSAKKITVTGIGSATFTASQELTWEPSDKAYLQFQAVGTNTLSVDDITISDGFYLENDYINEDFEHITNMSKNVTMLGLTRPSVDYQGIYDSTTKNTYLSLTASVAKDSTLHTAAETGICPSSGKPAVISFRLNTDETSNLTVGLRLPNSTYIEIVRIANGIASATDSAQTTTRDVSDGAFHTYRMVITPNASGAGYTSSLMIDTVYLGSRIGTTNITGGGRLEFRISNVGTVVGLDDFHVFYAETPQLRTVPEIGDTLIAIDGALTFEGNNPINYSTVTPAAFTLKADGTEETVPIKAFSAADFVTRNNTFILSFAKDLKPNTAYTLSVADNTLKDMYDQYYSGEIAAFTTGDDPEPKYNFTYTVNSEEVSGTDCLAAGTLGVTLDVRAYSAGANVLAVAALYDVSDNLISAQPMSSVLTEAGTDTKTVSLTISEEELSGAKVKLFLWDGVTYAPIREVTVLTPAAN